MAEGFIPTGFSHRRGLNTDFLQSEMSRLQQSGQFGAELEEKQFQFDQDLRFQKGEADRQEERFQTEVGLKRDAAEESKRAAQADEGVAARHATARESEVEISRDREDRTRAVETIRTEMEAKRVAIAQAEETRAAKTFEQAQTEYEAAKLAGDPEAVFAAAEGSIRAAISSDNSLSPEEALAVAGVDQSDPMYGQLLGAAVDALEGAEVRELKIAEIEQKLEKGEISNEAAKAELENFLLETDPELAQAISEIEVEAGAEAGPQIRNRDFLQGEMERDIELATKLENAVAPLIQIAGIDIGEEPEKEITVVNEEGIKVKQANPEWVGWNSLKQQQDMVQGQLETIDGIKSGIAEYQNQIEEIEAKLSKLKSKAQGAFGKERKSAQSRVKGRKGKTKKSGSKAGKKKLKKQSDRGNSLKNIGRQANKNRK